MSQVGGAIDVGSNSVHLLVGLVGAAGGGAGVTPLDDESALLGLGDVVDREGHVPAAARDALIGTLRTYAATATRFGALHLTLLGTEPLRRATNRSVVQADVLAAIGEPLHVLSHETEAYLTLLAVTGGVPPEVPLLVADIGGGSSETIFATPGERAIIGTLPTGSARLTAALVGHDPPTWFEINALRAEAARLVGALPAATPERCVMVGGTASNVLRVIYGVRGGRVLRAGVSSLFEILTARPADSLVQAFGINRRRAGMLAAGAALIEALMVRYGLTEVEVSAVSLREGAILARALAGDEWEERLPMLVTSPPLTPTSASGVQPVS